MTLCCHPEVPGWEIADGVSAPLLLHQQPPHAWQEHGEHARVFLVSIEVLVLMVRTFKDVCGGGAVDVDDTSKAKAKEQLR